MLTLPREQVVKPFVKINVWQEANAIRVRAYILVERALENVATGIAIDGSGTMQPWFGAQGGSAINRVAPIARSMCNYLISQLDYRGATDVIYWATGAEGRDIEVAGRISAEDAQQHPFAGPRDYGMNTFLVPAMTHFLNTQPSEAKQFVYIFITDGKIADLDAVKSLTTELALKIHQGAARPTKLLLIGVGTRIDEAQLRELDDLDTGTPVDVWDAKIAAKMDNLAEIFTEMVDETTIVAPRGVVRDAAGNVVKDYRDTGVPALLEFTLPRDAKAFSIEVGDFVATQPLEV